MSAGCKVPADARVMVAASNLACDQACLTGESDAVGKVADALVAMDAVLQVCEASGAALAVPAG